MVLEVSNFILDFNILNFNLNFILRRLRKYICYYTHSSGIVGYVRFIIKTVLEILAKDSLISTVQLTRHFKIDMLTVIN